MRIVGVGFHALPNKIEKIRKVFVFNYLLPFVWMVFAPILLLLLFLLWVYVLLSDQKYQKSFKRTYPLEKHLYVVASDKCQLSCRTVAQLAYTLCLGQLYVL